MYVSLFFCAVFDHIWQRHPATEEAQGHRWKGKWSLTFCSSWHREIRESLTTIVQPPTRHTRLIFLVRMIMIGWSFFFFRSSGLWIWPSHFCLVRRPTKFCWACLVCFRDDWSLSFHPTACHLGPQAAHRSIVSLFPPMISVAIGPSITYHSYLFAICSRFAPEIIFFVSVFLLGATLWW